MTKPTLAQILRAQNEHLFQALTDKGFEVEFQSHAPAILGVDFPEAVTELEEVLASATVPIEEIIGSGGGEAKGTQRLRRALTARAWTKGNFTIEKMINGVRKDSISHEVDHVRTFSEGTVAHRASLPLVPECPAA